MKSFPLINLSETKKLAKDNIGSPTNFKHVEHVGWDNDTGFEVQNVRLSLEEIFEKVGISKEKLNDASTTTFIYDFLERYGFQEEIKKLENSSSPGTPLIAPQHPTSPLRPAPLPPTSPPRTPPTPLPRNKKEDICTVKL